MKVSTIQIPETVSVALLVIAGEFGLGETRKQKLEKAGYNYRKVQNCVNELIPILERYGD